VARESSSEWQKGVFYIVIREDHPEVGVLRGSQRKNRNSSKKNVWS
jgi:hypothetical protein